MLYNLIVLFVAISTITAQDFYIGNAKNPDYPGKCYHKETERPLKFNEVYRPIGICQQITCRDDFVLHILYCPRFQIGNDCKVIAGDMQQPFPDCCAKIECVRPDGISEIRETYSLP